MDIQSASVSMAQSWVQEEAVARVWAMGLASMKAQEAELAKLLESVQALTDPNFGNNLNIFA